MSRAGRRCLLLACMTTAVSCGDDLAPPDANVDVPGSIHCDPGSCPIGQVCVAGSCEVPAPDEDRDGFPVSVDCDDADPFVGLTASRPCSDGVGCDSGLERCTRGRWSGCACPCECTPGEVSSETATCSTCGTQSRQGVCAPDCRWAWDPWSPCDVECTEGQVDIETRDCVGVCGSQYRTRSCDETTCGWGAWDTAPDRDAEGWTPCAGPGCSTCESDPTAECIEGEVETMDQPCCGTGTETSSRICGSDCRWGDWLPFGPCSVGECDPGDSRPCTLTGCGCGRGTQVGTQACDTNTCTWSACDPMGAPCLGDPVCEGSACGSPTVCPGGTGFVLCPGGTGVAPCACVLEPGPDAGAGTDAGVTAEFDCSSMCASVVICGLDP